MECLSSPPWASDDLPSGVEPPGGGTDGRTYRHPDRGLPDRAPADSRLDGQGAPGRASMLTCANCGRENPDDAVFCMGCAAPIASPTPSREQRKTVSILFCDLVGSTTLAEQHDPEVLRPFLQRYFDESRAA